MFKKLLPALLCIANLKITLSVINKSKKPNEITRIKLPTRFAIHPTSLSENQFKNRCPICGGDGVLWFGSVISNKSLLFQDKCPVCDGYGYGNEFDNIRPALRCEEIICVNILCKKEAFKTRLDAGKFLPMVVLK